MHILGIGAEAVISLKKGNVSKKRIRKGYRIREIDMELRKRRTKAEARIMKKAGEIINCPKILQTKDYEIIMEFIEGNVLKDVFESLHNKKEVCVEIGKSIKLLHKYDIIHGDLTTSNMILNDKVYFIDFGLSFISKKIEDKAVDLLLLKRALMSKHPTIWERCFSIILKEYRHEEVIKRMRLAEARGRYKKDLRKELGFR